MAEPSGGPAVPGRYFRLPRPAAVSTLAALTSPAPGGRRGGDEEELPGGTAGWRMCGCQGGQARRGGAPGGGWGPPGFRTGRHAGQPEWSQVRGGEGTVEPFQTLFRSMSQASG